MLRNKKGFTLIELMIVVAIIGILAAIAIPMYNANVNKAKLQEATDTLGALKDEVANYVQDAGTFPDWPLGSGSYNFAEGGILGVLGVQVPQSTDAAGNRKWTYQIVCPGDGSADLTYVVRATGGLGAGSVLNTGQIEVQGDWDSINGVFRNWAWATNTPIRIKPSWLPK